MASFEPIIRMDENAYRAPEKMQSKAGRKPLGDVTNSSKPLAKSKMSAKTFNVSKPQLKIQPSKVGRKPLGDLTNSNKHCANEKSSKKNCTENLSAVHEEQVPSWILNEGFLHNHDECIKAQRQSTAMSMDHFLETVGLKKDPSFSLFPELSEVAMAEKSELEIPWDLDKLELEMMDVSPPTPPALKSPPTPESPGSPFSIIDWKNLELSPLKLKESPTRD